MRDNPWFTKDTVECVSRASNNPASCNEPRAVLLNSKNPAENIDENIVNFADLSDLFCDISHCWAVSNGVLVYRDRHHLTGSFVRAHSDRLSREIVKVIGYPSL